MWILLLIVLSIYFGITRGIPLVASWMITYKFKVYIQIKKFTAHKLGFEDIVLKIKHLNIKIENIKITSSLLSQDEKKLIAIKLNDVRIEKEVIGNNSLPSLPTINARKDLSDLLSSSDIESLKIRVPPSIVSLAQFFSVHTTNLSVMYLQDKWRECLFHASANEVLLEGATRNDTNIALNGTVKGAHIRALLETEQKSSHSSVVAKDPHQDPSLMECNLSVKFYFELQTEVWAEMDTISFHVSSPEFYFHERIFSFLETTKQTQQTSSKSVLDSSAMLKKFWYFIPLKQRFKCEGLTVKVVRGLGRATAQGSLDNIDFQTHFIREGAFENFPVLLPDISTELQLDQLSVGGLHDSFLKLSQVNMQSQFIGDRVNIKTELRSVTGKYDPTDFESCLKFLSKRKRVNSNKASQRKSKPALQYCVGVIFEIWDVNLKASVPKISQTDCSDCQVNIQHYRLSLALSQGASQLAGELILESLLVTICCNESDLVFKRKVHHLGSVVSMGLCLLQINSVPGGDESCVNLPLHFDALIDNIQLEWSVALTNFISCVLKYASRWKNIIHSTRVSSQHQTNNQSRLHSLKGKCTAINLFCHASENVSLMLRTDLLECLKDPKDAKVSLTGIKSVRFTPNEPTYPCLKSDDIKDAWANMDSILVEYVNSEFLVSLSKHCSVDWSTTLHLTLITITKDVRSFVRSISGRKSDVNKTPYDLRLQIMAEGSLRLGAVLSKQHKVDFVSNNIIYLMANQRVSLQTDEFKILFDDKEVMMLKESKLVKVLQSVEIKEERESFPELELNQNVAWKLKVDTWKITFPYQYNFAETFSGDFISIIKWLKVVRNKPPNRNPTLPPDIVIRVKTLMAEVEDDPFEVKLRYNYELMEDEYQESCKRLEALEKKIEETRKTNLQLLSGKIDGLYKALADLNSETYIKRSKKMYNSEPIRTQLFLWKMEDVLIYALADPSFHGPEKVKAIMKEIDCESPWPEEEPQFTTLWCRMVSASCATWKFQLRDFPQSLWDMKQTEVWGRLVGAEQRPLNRSKRSVTIDVGDPWDNVNIERSLTSLKFYHDLTWEAQSFEAAYGPCWEPAMAQFNIAMNLISRPSRDPSLPLPWWDKARVMLHGRVNMQIDKMTLLLHASLDPYNTTEEMELTWNGFNIDWTNANLNFFGDLSVYVRTASKYDDARLLHLPNLKICVKLGWVCQGNPNDHHTLIPCAPDKLPEYSSNQEHDTYRVFRSQNLKLNISLETKQKKGDLEPVPIQMLFYGSTLRWFENLKFILSGVSRPTRRGRLFNNVAPRKPQLSRHYESIHLAISFQRVDIRYWMSVRVRKGFHMSAERLSLSSEHLLSLNKIDDGLIHRPRANWTTGFLNTELCQVQIWLQNVLETGSEKDNVSVASMATTASEGISATGPVEKFYFLNLTKVAYVREMPEPLFPLAESTEHTHRETPNHRLVVHNLKGVWTTSTRDIAFALYDSWDKNQTLKHNLSPDNIKNLNPGMSSTSQKQRPWSSDTPMSPTGNKLQVNNSIQNTPSPRTRLQSDHASSMLQQLVAEADNHFVVYANDCSTPEPRDQNLQRTKVVCTTEDVICKPWLIELENSQVLLKGCDTEGYVIISAAHSQISQRIHRPTWKDNSLVTKTSWSGSLECMQYYATVSEGRESSQMDNIMWLTVDNIEEKDGTVITEVPDIVGSGQSVGGVVSQTVGASDPESEQLQRIVSRCRCEFFYVSYGETGLDTSLLEEVQPPPSTEEGLWSSPIETADSFTLRHYDLCACTNSLQYNMVLDILNNLLLYADPKKKEARAALARMRFKLQLHSSEDQRKPIVSLQNKLRFHLSQLRFLEKEIYLLQRKIDKEPTNKLINRKTNLESQVGDCKEYVTTLSEELAMRIHLYNETQLSSNRKLVASKGIGKEKSLIRMNEVYFRKAQWRLTEPDGQLGIAQLDLSNFLYTKKTFSDDITEHLLELGFVNMSNLLPNQIYTNVLAPAELRSSMPVDRQKTLRIYCREKPPCGGIAIIEHLEINVVPLKIGLTSQFKNRMMKFCFPNNQTDDDDVSSGSKKGEKMSTISKQKKGANFYVALQKDEVEIMKQRAEQNKLFVYIKITEVPVELSFKAKRNIQDIENYPLLVRTIEYHSVTWTWLDLLLAIKQSSKSLITQAISYKLKLNRLGHDESTMESEEEKMKLLLGAKALPQEKRVGKKTLFRSSK